MDEGQSGSTSSGRIQRKDMDELGLRDTVELVFPPLEKLSQADPDNIQEVAASVLGLNHEYYEKVLAQAQRSFTAALWGVGLGTGCFVVAVGIVFFGDRGTFVAAIPVIAGAIAEFFAGVNFYLYGQATRQLGTYHSRLDRIYRFLIANSVCEQLEGNSREEARSLLVQTIARPEEEITSQK